MALSTLIIHRPEILMNEKSTKVTLSEKQTDQNLLGLKSGSQNFEFEENFKFGFSE